MAEGHDETATADGPATPEAAQQGEARQSASLNAGPGGSPVGGDHGQEVGEGGGGGGGTERGAAQEQIVPGEGGGGGGGAGQGGASLQDTGPGAAQHEFAWSTAGMSDTCDLQPVLEEGDLQPLLGERTSDVSAVCSYCRSCDLKWRLTPFRGLCTHCGGQVDMIQTATAPAGPYQDEAPPPRGEFTGAHHARQSTTHTQSSRGASPGPHIWQTQQTQTQQTQVDYSQYEFEHVPEYEFIHWTKRQYCRWELDCQTCDATLTTQLNKGGGPRDEAYNLGWRKWGTWAKHQCPDCVQANRCERADGKCILVCKAKRRQKRKEWHEQTLQKRARRLAEEERGERPFLE